MADRAPELERREVRLPDGRRLLYYPFPGASPPREEATASDARRAPAPQPRAGRR
jgi:hypothetical protein